ncbi:MAG: hypothetical protein LUE27_08120 [Clostridia bacterium]|nr:hypothetical protein [Clostridia bacterium]
MALDWLKLDPASGTDDAAIKVTASEHTGRVGRTGTVTGTTAGGKTATAKVTQAAKEEFTTLSGFTIKDGKVTVTGTSNSAAVAVDTPIEGVEKYALTVDGAAQSGWDGVDSTAVDGDPGAAAQYGFTITFDLPASLNEAGDNSATLGVNGETIEITNDNVESYISFDLTELSFEAAGGDLTLNVTSNDSWTLDVGDSD